MVKLFDTHTHYDDKAFTRLPGGADALFARFFAEDSPDNVAGFMAVGCNLRSSRAAIAIAERFPTVRATVGVQPHDCNEPLPADWLSQLEELARSPQVRAIGECGLDYHYDGYNRESQLRAFGEQLDLAAKLGLPVVVHSRDAAQDTGVLLRERLKTKAVMHCYSGSVETARELVKQGIMLSFTGVVTFKNAKKALEVCREIPLEMLMLETDCPYMSPEPFRGKICDSSLARYSAAKIAEVKGLSTDEVIAVCNDNAKRFFDIDF